MYLVLYDERIRDVVEIDETVEVEGNTVIWATGKQPGIKTDFIIVDQVPETITEEVIALDRKHEFKKVDEVTQLKERLSDTETALINIMDMWGV